MGPRTLVKLALEEGTTKVRHHYVMLNLLQYICRDVEEKGPYTYGPVVMAVMKMIVLLMATSRVYTPSLLELLELMVTIVILMRDAQRKWLQLM